MILQQFAWERTLNRAEHFKMEKAKLLLISNKYRQLKIMTRIFSYKSSRFISQALHRPGQVQYLQFGALRPIPTCKERDAGKRTSNGDSSQLWSVLHGFAQQQYVRWLQTSKTNQASVTKRYLRGSGSRSRSSTLASRSTWSAHIAVEKYFILLPALWAL